MHLSSLRRTIKYASFLNIRAPCIWSFLLCHLFVDFLRVHQTSMHKQKRVRVMQVRENLMVSDTPDPGLIGKSPSPVFHHNHLKSLTGEPIMVIEREAENAVLSHKTFGVF